VKPLDRVRVLIGPSSFGEYDRAPLDRLIDAGYKVVDNPYKRKLSKAELADLLAGGIVGLVAGLEPLDREVLAKSTLKVISRCGAGLSNVDMATARELGIEVYSTPQAPSAAVAELTLGAMLCLLRMVPQMDRDLHRGEWNKRIGWQLAGKTVLIVGFGRIGRRLAALLRPFDVQLLAADPDPTAASNEDHVPVVSLQEGLPQADVVTIHCSGHECVLGEKEFELAKAGVFVLNAARGGVVDECALARAIESGKVAGAWLDVFEAEPYQGPLSSCPQVLLTPHVGSYTVECRRSMELEAVENLIAALRRKAVQP